MKKVSSLGQLQTLVRRGESETLELKKTTGEASAGIADFVSLLNHKGGHLVFGVDPGGAILGQQIADKTRRDLASEIPKIEPTVVPEQTEVRVRDNLYCIVLHAEPDPGAVPYSYDGRGYERVGPTTRKMKQQRYDQLIARRQAAASPWENQPATGVRAAHLDPKRIRAVAKAAGYPRARTSAVATLLGSLGVVRSDKQLTRAALVAFGRSLLPDYPQCQIRLARFVGTKRGNDFVERPREVEGNVFDLLEAAETFLARHIPTPSFIPARGIRRVVRELVPTKALREVLVNALVHRDYGQLGATVGVAIFDDRVDVENPGSLPAGIEAEKFFGRHASLPRNPLIAGIVHRTGLMERWGTGGERIRQACKDAGTRPPSMTSEAGWVRVTFRARLPRTAGVLAPTPQVTPQVTPLVRAVLSAAAAAPATRAELQAAAGLKDREHFRKEYLEPLIASGLLTMTIPDKPQSRHQRYALTSAGRRALRRSR